MNESIETIYGLSNRKTIVGVYRTNTAEIIETKTGETYKEIEIGGKV